MAEVSRCEPIKRVYRLYSAANLAVRKRKKAKRPISERVPLRIPKSLNEVWIMVFVCDSLSNGRRITCLTVADDFSHQCVAESRLTQDFVPPSQ